jgi:hypothetical protein
MLLIKWFKKYFKYLLIVFGFFYFLFLDCNSLTTYAGITYIPPWGQEGAVYGGNGYDIYPDGNVTHQYQLNTRYNYRNNTIYMQPYWVIFYDTSGSKNNQYLSSTVSDIYGNVLNYQQRTIGNWIYGATQLSGFNAFRINLEN